MRKGKILKKFAAGVLTGAMALAMLVSSVSAETDDKPTEGQELDLNGTYHAALGIQTSTKLWIQRMAYFESTQNKMYGTDMNDKLFYVDSDTEKDEAVGGTFTDVEIAGNGTYTVSLSGADFKGETAISQMHIATDIPVNDAIQFSNVEVKINGRTVVKFDEAVMEEEKPYIAAGMDILIMNHWRPELRTELEGKGLAEDASSGWNLLVGSGDDNISVSFTVSGFAYDKEADDPEPETTAQAPTSGDPAQTKGTDPIEGKGSVLPIGAIVGIIAGAVVVVVIVIAVIVSRKKK